MSIMDIEQKEPGLDDADRALIRATQGGLPLTSKPYHLLADQLGLSVRNVQERLQRMLDQGTIRRIAAVPNQYALGFKANGMSVWNVPDERASLLGKKIGALDFVSHAYRRPRHLPDWPYNLFAMVHGRDRATVEKKVDEIARLLGADNLGHEILYSKRILKKTGLRLRTPDQGRS